MGRPRRAARVYSQVWYPSPESDGHHTRGARTHNLKNVDLDLPRDQADRDHRPVGLGQVLARLRHALRRGPAPLRRIAVGLCAAVPVDDGQARRRPHRGPVAGHLDRAEIDLAQPALHRRHHHRDLRLPAPAVRPRRRAALPDHGSTLAAQTVSQMVDQVLALPEGAKLMLLAPGGAERKGEHLADCSRSCAARASCARASMARLRARRRAEARQAPQAHHRGRRRPLRVRADLAQRLAESFETALRWPMARRDRRPDGRAGRGARCSRPLRLPALRLQHAELEPRLFSFNNPAGACPSCDGLGVSSSSIRSASCAFPQLSAWPGRDPRLGPAQRLLLPDAASSLAKHYGFDIDTPSPSCPKRSRERVLLRQRRGGHRVPLRERARRRDPAQAPFEGIVPNLERRYRETESALVREELAKFLGTRPARTARAARLRPRRATSSSRPRCRRCHALSVGEAQAFFELSCPAGAARSPTRSSRNPRPAAASWSTSASTT
jgi:excinuclease ABC subunit A